MVRVVATAVEAVDGDLRLEVGVVRVAAMAVWRAVALAIAALDLAVGSAELGDKAASEVVAPAVDREAFSVVPVGLRDKMKELVAVPYLVDAMEAVI